jgi:hypothetical protein
MSYIYKNLPVDIQEIIDNKIIESNPYEEFIICELNNYFYENCYKYSQTPYNVNLPSMLYLIGEE